MQTRRPQSSHVDGLFLQSERSTERSTYYTILYGSLARAPRHILYASCTQNGRTGPEEPCAGTDRPADDGLPTASGGEKARLQVVERERCGNGPA